MYDKLDIDLMNIHSPIEYLVELFHIVQLALFLAQLMDNHNVLATLNERELMISYHKSDNYRFNYVDHKE